MVLVFFYPFKMPIRAFAEHQAFRIFMFVASVDAVIKYVTQLAAVFTSWCPGQTVAVFSDSDCWTVHDYFSTSTNSPSTSLYQVSALMRSPSTTSAFHDLIV